MQIHGWSYLLCKVLCIICSMAVNSIHFNTSGYEHCTFNLAQNDGNANMASRDLVESLLAQTAGFQLWTIFQIFYRTDKPFLPNINVTNFNERCSVNIVVSLEECFKLNLWPIFHHRLYSTKNTFIMLLGNDLEFTYTQQYNHAFDQNIGSVYFASFFLFDNTNAVSVCFFCSHIYRVYRLPWNMDRRNLGEIRNFTDEIVKISTVPIMPIMGSSTKYDTGYDLIYVKKCAYLYQIRFGVNPFKIGCHRDLIPIVNAANFLNVSITVMKFKGTDMFNEAYVWPRARYPAYRQHYYAVLLVRLFEMNSLVSSITLSERSFVILEKEVKRFIYCVEFEERKGFTFLFWIAPMDVWSWTCLGISCYFLTIQLRGQWFQVYSILMRQSCSVLEKNKTVIIFIFASIIFTYGYEGVVSSFLTVLPPVRTLKTLKELIENNYKLIGLSLNPLYTPHQDLKDLFIKENITTSVEAAIANDTYPISIIKRVQLLAKYNATFYEDHDVFISLSRVVIYWHYPNTSMKCYETSGTTITHDQVYHILGTFNERVTSILNRMREAGLLQMYEFIHSYILELSIEAKAGDRINLNSTPVPFRLNDWKILSIFIVWSVLLGIAIFQLTLEFCANTWISRI